MNKNRKLYIGIIGIYLFYLLVLLNIFMGIHFNEFGLGSWLFFGFEIITIFVCVLCYFTEPGSCDGWS